MPGTNSGMFFQHDAVLYADKMLSKQGAQIRERAMEIARIDGRTKVTVSDIGMAVQESGIVDIPRIKLEAQVEILRDQADLAERFGNGIVADRLREKAWKLEREANSL